MNAQRRNEITGSIAAITAIAALATGLMATKGAYAAPTKTKQKSTVRVQHAKKPVYVKIVGDSRAAQARADQLYAAALSNAAAEAETRARLQDEANSGNNTVATNQDPNNAPTQGSVPYYPDLGSYNTIVGYGPGSYIAPGYNNGFNFNGGYPFTNSTGPYTTNTVVNTGGYGFLGSGFQIGNYSPSGVSFYQF